LKFQREETEARERRNAGRAEPDIPCKYSACADEGVISNFEFETSERAKCWAEAACPTVAKCNGAKLGENNRKNNGKKLYQVTHKKVAGGKG
jgi:hypothetical protein